MVNKKIIELLKENNINEEQGLSYLFCLYLGYKNLSFISYDVQTMIKLLQIVSIENNLVSFNIPLFLHTTEVLDDYNNMPIDEFVKKKWTLLFPTRKETNLPYDISGNTAACISRMTSFLKGFNKLFDVNYTTTEKYAIIYKATQNYMATARAKGYAYTKKNSKFISDENGSVLEDYIRRILKGEMSDIEMLSEFTREAK